jgi:hypothetical protein
MSLDARLKKLEQTQKPLPRMVWWDRSQPRPEVPDDGRPVMYVSWATEETPYIPPRPEDAA